jgi:type I restriction enzyme S subunit
MKENLSNFAEDWKWTKLEEIVDKMSNGITQRQSKEEKGMSVTRIETISNGTIDLTRVGYLNNLTQEAIEKYKLLKGDILFSHINSDLHLGKTAIFNFSNFVLLHGMNLLLIRPNKLIIIPKFLNYLFNYYRFTGFFISIAQHAVNQSSINQRKLKNLPIPLPSINEQNRIVEKIEELFSDLDKATEELKKTQEQLKIYRQAVLEVAFGSTLEKNIFKIKTIEEIITEKQIGLVKSNKEQNSASIGVPYIKMNNINTLGDVDINDNIVYVNVNNEELDKYKLKKNDLLINTRNSFELVGKSGIVKDDNVDRVFNNNILRLRFKNSIIPKFVNYQLLSNEIRQQIRREKKATTNVCALYQRDILPLKFKVPKINIQNDIVNDIEYKLSVCDGLMETVKQSLEKIEYLRQSILKKTFKGKLVQQDPNDESTEKLLERIKQEKEKFELNKKKRK